MPNTPELSLTKRDLLEKYLRGDLPPTLKLPPERGADVLLWLLYMYRLLTVCVLHHAAYRDLRAKGALNLPLMPGTDLLRQRSLRQRDASGA